MINILENGQPPYDEDNIRDLDYILIIITGRVTDKIISDFKDIYFIRDLNSPSPSINSKINNNDNIILVSHNIPFLLN